MKRSPLATYSRLERHTPIERGEQLRATQWGTRKKHKVESWRDEYLDFPDDDKPKYTAAELGYMAAVRALPCIRCGHDGTDEMPNQASHVTTSADQKGTGMKVPTSQVVSHCFECHPQWEGRSGFCAGWSKERRYRIGARWVKATQATLTPDSDSFDHALDLAELGAGRVVVEATGNWHWVPAWAEVAA